MTHLHHSRHRRHHRRRHLLQPPQSFTATLFIIYDPQPSIFYDQPLGKKEAGMTIFMFVIF